MEKCFKTVRENWKNRKYVMETSELLKCISEKERNVLEGLSRI